VFSSRPGEEAVDWVLFIPAQFEDSLRLHEYQQLDVNAADGEQLQSTAPSVIRMNARLQLAMPAISPVYFASRMPARMPAWRAEARSTKAPITK
jgi:hypothetical protein